MIDVAVVTRLDGERVPFCLIGAMALAARGYARFTSDVDLLTLDDRVLHARFWSGLPATIRRGDFDDPFEGVVAFESEPPCELLVGRGHAMRFAVETAEPHPALPCRVASALALVLLKLEAASFQDRADVVELVRAQRALNGAPWLAELPPHLPRLSAHARAAWTSVAPALGAT